MATQQVQNAGLNLTLDIFENNEKVREMIRRLENIYKKEGKEDVYRDKNGFILPADLIQNNVILENVAKIMKFEGGDVLPDSKVGMIKEIFKYAGRGIPVNVALAPIILHFPNILKSIRNEESTIFMHLIGDTNTGKSFSSKVVLSSLLYMYAKTVEDLKSGKKQSETLKGLKNYFDNALKPMLESIGINEKNFKVDDYLKSFYNEAKKLSASPNAPEYDDWDYIRKPVLYEQVAGMAEGQKTTVLTKSVKKVEARLATPDKMGILDDIFSVLPERVRKVEIPYLNTVINTADKGIGLLLFTHNPDKKFAENFIAEYGKVLGAPREDIPSYGAFSRLGFFIPISEIDPELKRQRFDILSRMATEVGIDLLAFSNIENFLTKTGDDIAFREIRPGYQDEVKRVYNQIKKGFKELLNNYLKIKYGDDYQQKIKKEKGEGEFKRVVNEAKSEILGIFDRMNKQDLEYWIKELYDKNVASESKNFAELYTDFKGLYRNYFIDEIGAEIGKKVEAGLLDEDAIDRYVAKESDLEKSLYMITRGIKAYQDSMSVDTNTEGITNYKHTEVGEKESLINKFSRLLDMGLNFNIIKKFMNKEKFYEKFGISEDDIKNIEDLNDFIDNYKKEKETEIQKVEQSKKKMKGVTDMYKQLYERFDKIFNSASEDRNLKQMFENLETALKSLSTDLRNVIPFNAKHTTVAQAINRRHICQIIGENAEAFIEGDMLDLDVAGDILRLSREALGKNRSVINLNAIFNSMKAFLDDDMYKTMGRRLILSMFGFDPVITPALFNHFELALETKRTPETYSQIFAMDDPEIMALHQYDIKKLKEGDEKEIEKVANILDMLSKSKDVKSINVENLYEDVHQKFQSFLTPEGDINQSTYRFLENIGRFTGIMSDENIFNNVLKYIAKNKNKYKDYNRMNELIGIFEELSKKGIEADRASIPDDEGNPQREAAKKRREKLKEKYCDENGNVKDNQYEDMQKLLAPFEGISDESSFASQLSAMLATKYFTFDYAD